MNIHSITSVNALQRWLHTCVWVACLILVGSGAVAIGDDLVVSDTATSNSSDQFVLLRNDHVLRGQVTIRGSSILIRRGSSSELTLRSDQVFAIRENIDSLFEVRQSMKHRRSQPTINELVEDARWCVDQKMPNQATALLIQIYALVPDHPVARQLETRLRRATGLGHPEDATISHAAGLNTASESRVTQPISSLAQGEEDVNPEEIDVTRASFTTAGDTLATGAEHDGTAHRKTLRQHFNARSAPQELHSFTARIQPILLSRCGQCHHEKTSSEWTLAIPHSGSRVTQSGTLRNLQSALVYCEPGDAESSELFQMAIKSHGALPGDVSVPPIDPHEVRLISALRYWINALTVGTPTNRSESPINETSGDVELKQAKPADVMASLSPLPQSPLPLAANQPNVVDRVDRKLSSDDLQGPTAAMKAPVRGQSIRPVRLPQVVNPDDVRHFNRETEVRKRFGF